jgi:hypothetical protein
VQEGIFNVSDCNLTAKALISMLTGICTWYQPTGRLGLEELEKQHIELSLRMVGFQPT